MAIKFINWKMWIERKMNIEFPKRFNPIMYKEMEVP